MDRTLRVTTPTDTEVGDAGKWVGVVLRDFERIHEVMMSENPHPDAPVDVYFPGYMACMPAKAARIWTAYLNLFQGLTWNVEFYDAKTLEIFEDLVEGRATGLSAANVETVEYYLRDRKVIA